MNIVLNVSSEELDTKHLQTLTHELCQKIKIKTYIDAELSTVKKENIRGDFIEIGKIILSAFTNDSIKVFLEIIKAYISREQSLEIMLQNPDGSIIKVNAKNINSKEIEQILKHWQEGNN